MPDDPLQLERHTAFAAVDVLPVMDENIEIDKYLKGIKYAAAIMEEFGKR